MKNINQFRYGLHSLLYYKNPKQAKLDFKILSKYMFKDP
jgi:hypothetical protein